MTMHRCHWGAKLGAAQIFPVFYGVQIILTGNCSDIKQIEELPPEQNLLIQVKTGRNPNCKGRFFCFRPEPEQFIPFSDQLKME